jgi:hypothetical protein
VREHDLALARGQLDPAELGRHGFSYGDKDFLMAEITGGPYGRNYFAMAIFPGEGEIVWQKLFAYGEIV